MSLNRDAILAAAQGPDTEEVPVPKWGGSVRVRGMTGTERDRFELGGLAHKDNLERLAGMRAKVVAWCTVDDDGRRVFGDKDLVWLGNQDALTLDPIYTTALRLSGITESAVQEAEADFTPARNGDSSSASPGTSGAPSVNSSPPSTPVS